MKKEILLKSNIKLNCESVDRETAIKNAGALMVETGYVTPEYVEGMLRRDAQLSVYVGNYLAIPHGEFEVKNEILSSGIVLFVYPDGIDWHGENVKVVLGLAGIDNEHMEILSSIAMLFAEVSLVDDFIELETTDAVYDYIMKGLES